MREWSDDGWWWVWRWRWGLFVWEEEVLVELKSLLANVFFFAVVLLQQNVVDAWQWKDGSSRMFTVRSAYHLIQSYHNTLPTNDLLTISKRLWLSYVPSKILAFTWRLLRDRLPTTIQLKVI